MCIRDRAKVALRLLATFEELAARAEIKGILQGDDRASLTEWKRDASAWSRARGGA